MRVSCVAGARPNFMKVKPVLDALERVGLETDLVHTGQHYDASMSDVFFSDLGLRPPDVHLGVGSGSHAEQTARVMVEHPPVSRCPELWDGHAGDRIAAVIKNALANSFRRPTESDV